MIDQSLVRSGFDIEVLLGERYLRYALLTLIDTGTFPLDITLTNPPLAITVRPPEEFDRLYGVHPEATLPPPVAAGILVSLLFDHPSGAGLLLTLTTVEVRHIPTGGAAAGVTDLFFRFALEVERDDQGNPLNPKLELKLVDTEGPLIGAAQGPPFNITKEEILGALRSRLDRSIDLGVIGEGETVESVALRAHAGDGEHSAAVGVYLNLRLRNGPDANEFLADRGDLENARNFLPPGDDLAFATRTGLFRALGRDRKFRLAEPLEPVDPPFPTPAFPTPSHHFPLRESLGDPDSKQIGRIKDISVFPLTFPTTPPTPRNILRIDIHGEYFLTSLFSPDFHLIVDLVPTLDHAGLLDWKVEFNVDVGLLFKFLPLLTFSTLFILLGGSGLVVSSMIGAYLLAAERVAAAHAQGILASRIPGPVQDASFVDALPDRLTIERRRWDPLHTTLHQVVTRPSGIVINQEGIAFSGVALVGKTPTVLRSAVIRDEARDEDGRVTHLRYRVGDIRRVEADFEPVFPGTDRRPFSRPDDEREPTLVELSLDQIDDRIASDRLQPAIPYVARRVHIRDNQVNQLLCLSQREINEQRNRLLREFREAEAQDIEQQQGEEIREAVAAELEEERGAPPTPEEIEERFQERVDDLVAEAEKIFVVDDLPAVLERALAELDRFDLSPRELGALQRRDVLVLRAFQLIEIKRGARQGTLYYRDPPDGDPTNNVMSLPRYRPEAP